MGWLSANVVVSVGPYPFCSSVGESGLSRYQRRISGALSCSPPMTTRRTVAKLPGTVSATALNSVAVTNIVSTRSRTSASANALGSRTVSSSRITHVPPVSSGAHTSKLIASKAGLARQANRVPWSSQPGSASRRTPASRTSTPLGRPVVPEV